MTKYLAALFLALSSLVAHAAGVVDNKTGVVFCSAYSSASFGPDGNVRINDCVSNGTGTPPVTAVSAGTLSVAPALSSPTLLPGWNSSVTVARTGGSAGAVQLFLGVSGGCQLGSDHLDWADGDTGSPSVGINTPPGVASCTISLVSATSGAAINPSAQSITLSSAALAKCALPITPGARPQSFGFGDNTLIDMPSGSVAYAPLTSVRAATSGVYSAGLVIFESTSTAPTDGDMEISINHCPGAIDTNGGVCYSKYSIPNSVQWTEQSGATNTATTCGADPANGPWYINVRFNYTRCSWGQCGYVGQLLYRGS